MTTQKPVEAAIKADEFQSDLTGQPFIVVDTLSTDGRLSRMGPAQTRSAKQAGVRA